MSFRLTLLLLLPFLIAPTGTAAQNSLDLPRLAKNGAIRVEREDGTPIIQFRDTEPLVPASTLKIATSFCALHQLGPDFRYETLFFTDGTNTLYIKGSGDPSLVSETLDSIAQDLVKKTPKIDRIIIDTSLFVDDIAIDGSERSLNPYDAKNAAFVGNFSSAYLTRSRKGTVSSAEPQTPLTPLAQQAGARLQKGQTERVNLSSNWKLGVQYGGELLAAFLQKHGARGAMSISRGSIPSSARRIFSHRSPQTLSEILQPMLKYSTNFTANQIFLALGLSRFGAPATVEKAQRAMTECLAARVHWQDFHVEEGSGLSRRNKVSAQQMTQLLKAFEPYRYLLPEQDGFLAKTGSLRGVNSLAGYFTPSKQVGPVRFTILVNSEVPHLYKFTVANELRNYLKNKGN
jgi:D-alanyl-D-alanine carboxypeptidase/D-alanyl-D-alanine-endopeptidase (penicillin-binding protein 4)